MNTPHLITKKTIAFVALILVLLAGGSWLTCRVLSHRALAQGKKLLEKDFNALAEDITDCYRRSLVKNAEGCTTLLNIYFKTRNYQRLEWASESCLENGQEIPAAYLGLSAVKESQNLSTDALGVLEAGFKKFPKSAEFPYRMSAIYRKEKQLDPAVASMVKAINTAPENKQITLEALQYFSSIERWAEARDMADRLKSLPVENPELKLMVARALQHGGDMGSARVLVADAKKLLAGKPDLEKALNQAYSDVFKNGQ